MTPTIYGCDTAPDGKRFVGIFMTDEGEATTVLFFGEDYAELRGRMAAWLEAERTKVGLTAEIIEKRKAALAAARAARKAKKAEPAA